MNDVGKKLTTKRWAKWCTNCGQKWGSDVGKNGKMVCMQKWQANKKPKRFGGGGTCGKRRSKVVTKMVGKSGGKKVVKDVIKMGGQK